MSELTKIWSGLEAETYTSILHFVLIEGEYDEIYMDNTTFKLIKRKGDEIDILVQKRKDKGAAICFFKRLLKGLGVMPLKIVTDKLASYSAAKKELIPSIEHSTVHYQNVMLRLEV